MLIPFSTVEIWVRPVEQRERAAVSYCDLLYFGERRRPFSYEPRERVVLLVCELRNRPSDFVRRKMATYSSRVAYPVAFLIARLHDTASEPALVICFQLYPGLNAVTRLVYLVRSTVVFEQPDHYAFLVVL
jgi:hypothetical protein